MRVLRADETADFMRGSRVWSSRLLLSFTLSFRGRVRSRGSCLFATSR